MNVLVVSSYPPRHCGIGAYARDQVERLRSEGHRVTVLTAPDGEGDLLAPLVGGAVFRRAARIGGGFDRILVHFQPALYFAPRRPVSKVITALSLACLATVRGRRLEILVHEADPPKLWRPDYLLVRWAFARAHRVTFHTEAERAGFERAYRVRVRGRLVPHLVETHAGPGRRQARERLGLQPDEGPIFVCAGFLQPSKGFDRAVEAFASSRSNGARLFIVGSVRDPSPENLAFARALRERAGAVGGVTILERYVSDEELDLWVAAADRVVLPYRRSWSSGILARAHALGTPAVVSAVGGLPEQADEHDVVVHDDDELARVMAQAAPPGGRP